MNLRTIWEATGNAGKNFFALECAPCMVYPYSHVKLFDNINTSQYISQKRCFATFRNLWPDTVQLYVSIHDNKVFLYIFFCISFFYIIFVILFCELFLWIIFVNHFFESFFWIILWIIFVNHFCESLLWIIFVNHFCESFSWIIFCESLFWISFVN